MKERKWNIPEAVPVPKQLLRAGCTPLLAVVLASRGIVTGEQARAFLYDGPPRLEDPFLLADMDAAVTRIRRAVDKNEIVAVYGDYDVDGITAACLLTEYLRDLGLRVHTYIPDRLEEGYGVNTGAIDRLLARGVTLIVTVDCGITAVREAAYAAERGVDMIVTDHHECQAELPAAVAVVDPKRTDGPAAGRTLAGVGVAFKLACALSGDSRAMLERFCDLAAVGTVADVMPLTGENRAIVRAGLERLRTGPRPGLAALMDQAGVNTARLGASTVGFTLAPRINAAGRLGRVRCAEELVLERDPDRAARLAEELCDMNRQRQQLEAAIWDEAAEMLAGRTVDGPIVLAREGWHQGVVGIVASRLSETYQVPTVMISLDGDKGKGSCRSWGGFNLFDALAACGEHLDSFGGHALAAGLNLRRENIPAFRDALRAYYLAHPPDGEEGLTPDLTVTGPELLTMGCVESLEAMEPYGSGNQRPTLCMTDAALADVTAIGGGKHLRLTLEKFGQRYECVWFGKRAADLDLTAGQEVDAAFFPQISEHRGRRSVQLLMVDMRRTDLEGLCRHILERGGPCGQSMTRPELVRLWRALESRCPCRVKLSRLSELDGRLHPAQAAMGLRVLSELGLAAVSLSGQDVDIRLIAWTDKTELDRSPTWKARPGKGT